MTGEYRYIPPKPPLGFTVGILAGFGGLAGVRTALGDTGLLLPVLASGAVLFAAFSFAVTRLGDRGRLAAWLGVIAFFCVGAGLVGFAYGVLMAIVGYIAGGMTCWLASGRYRLNLSPYATARQVLWFYSFRVICGMIFVFLIMPIFVLIPLSFNQEPYFSFTPGMLRFDPLAYSLRWYIDILQNGMVDPAAVVGWWNDMWSNAQWIRSIRNSFSLGSGRR